MGENLPRDVLDAAAETYHLERALHDLDREALENAIVAALRKYEEIVLIHAAEIAASYASEIEEDNNIPGHIALRWFAEKIRSEITQIIMPEEYIPRDGDRVEVILIGEVAMWESECAKCGHAEENGTWSVTTDSGHEYFFDLKETKGKIPTRILSREED